MSIMHSTLRDATTPYTERWAQYKMKRTTLLIIVFTIPSLTFSQNQLDNDIFNRIIEYELQNGEFYVQCEKSPTHFDHKEFEEQNGSEVPKKILIQLQNEALKSTASNWPDSLMNGQTSVLFIRTNQCLTKNDCENLFNSSGQRQNIISISDPIFDTLKEHCVVSIN